MAQEKEPSEYDREETTYRIKSARAKYCELGLDISGGLLKALPPVAMTNLAVILALSQWVRNAAPGDNTSDIQRLVDIALTTFVFFLGAVLLVAILVWQITPRLVKNTRHAEWSDINVRAIKTHTLASLGDYSGVMPRIQLSVLRPALLDDSGKMNMQWVRPDWRTQHKVPEKMQRNLEDLYPELIKKMDELPPMVVEYCTAFDVYSEEFQKAYNTTWGKKTGAHLLTVDNHDKGRIIGSYFWFSGEVQNPLDLEGGRSEIVIDELTEVILREFLNGNPLDPNNVASMRLRSDLKELAGKARRSWEKANYKWMEIHGIVKEIRQRGV